MADDLRVRGIIELLLKGKGGKDASRQLDQTAKDADRATKSIGRAEKAAQSFGRALTTYLGAAVITGFVKRSIGEFAAYERALGSLGSTFRDLGVDVDSNTEKVKKFAEALQVNTGIAAQDTIAQFNAMVGIVGDVEGALTLITTAAGAAESTTLDFSTASLALTNILQGRMSDALKQLHVSQNKTTGDLKSQDEALKEVIEKYAKLAGTQTDAAASLGTLSGEWNQFKLDIGEVGAYILPPIVSTFRNLLKLFHSLGPMALYAGETIIGVFRGLKNAIGDFSLRKLFTGDFSGLSADLSKAFNEGLASVNYQVRGAADEFNAIWSDTAAEAGKVTAEGMQAALEAASAAAKREAAKEAEKERERLRKEAEQRAEFQRNADEALLRQRLQMTEEGSAERLYAELELLDRAHAQAIENAQKINAGTDAIDETFRLAKLEKERAYQVALGELEAEEAAKRNEADYKAFVEHLKAKIDAAAANSQERLDAQIKLLEIERNHELDNVELTEQARFSIIRAYALKIEAVRQNAAEQTAALKRRLASEDLQLQREAAHQAIALNSQFFGENKAFQYAVTIVNTAAAAMAAYARTGSPWAAAAAIAAGAVQLAVIASTNIGSGRGATAGSLAQGIPGLVADNQELNGPNQHDASRSERMFDSGGRAAGTYVFNGPNIISDSQMRRFMRKAREAERRDQMRLQR